MARMAKETTTQINATRAAIYYAAVFGREIESNRPWNQAYIQARGDIEAAHGTEVADRLLAACADPDIIAKYLKDESVLVLGEQARTIAQVPAGGLF